MALSLKQQNMLLLAPAVTVHILLMSVWTNLQPIWAGDVVEALKSTYSISTAVLSGIVATVLTGVLSAKFKSIFVFLKVQNPLPGCRAFSVHLPNDPRLSVDFWTQRLGKLPEDPREQNTTWYKIYFPVKDTTSVRSVHKHYLFCRDLTAINLVFLILSIPVGLHLNIALEETGTVFLAYLANYFLVALAAQNYGKRLVTTALAVAEHS